MADKGLHQRTTSTSMAPRSQTILQTKQKILTNQLRKASTAIDREQLRRQREFAKRKVNLKCQYSDLSAEKARATLKAMEEREDWSIGKASNVKLPALATTKASLWKSKSETNLLAQSTATQESCGTTLPPLKLATSMASLSNVEKSDEKQDGVVDWWDTYSCNYVRMPKWSQRPAVYRSLHDVTTQCGSGTGSQEDDANDGVKQKI